MCLFAVLTVVSVIFFRSRFLINWDAGQFALGTIHFSLSEHTPHPPGYFLFMQAGKLLTFLTQDINLSFVLLASLASFGAVLFFYKSVLSVTDRPRVAVLASTFLFLNPILWYEHLVALTYTFEALAISLSLFLTIQVVEKKNNSAFIFAIAGLFLLMGFRPSILLASFPLLLIQAWHLRGDLRTLCAGIASGLLCFSLWFFPFTFQAGGIGPALLAIVSQARAANAASLFDMSNASLFFQSLLFAFNILFVLFFLRPRVFLKSVSSQSVRAAAFALAFMAGFFIFFHFGEVGYILAVIPLLLFLLVPIFSSLERSSVGKTALACLLAIQVGLSFIPLPWIDNRKLKETNAIALGKHDERIQTYLSTVRSFDPREVIVLVLRGQYFDHEKTIRAYPSEDIRLLSYYLPDYTLYDLLGTPGFYLTAVDYKKTEHMSASVSFSPHARKLLILTDYLHPTVYPRGATLDHPATLSGSKNIYTASLDNIDSFEFEGFSFTREKK